MRAFTPILTARQMRRCDAYTIRETGVPSHILMERAAAALVRCIDSRPALFPAGKVLRAYRHRMQLPPVQQGKRG